MRRPGWLVALCVSGMLVGWLVQGGCGDDSVGGGGACGDGILDVGEACDGDDFGGVTCESLGLGTGTLACNGDCTLDTSGCEQHPACGNGILEVGEECDEGVDNSDSDPDACRTDCALPTCGDGVADNGEECDGDDLLGQDCSSVGLGGGALACRGDCTLDTSGCEQYPECGNGIVEEGEECDEGMHNSDSEPDACRRNCTLSGCGDGITDSGEECDEGMHNSDSDPDACRTDCTLPTCGDGVADSGEECDGLDMNEQTCEDRGYIGGVLTCRVDCTFDEALCESNPVCGNGVVERGEACDDGNTVDFDGCTQCEATEFHVNTTTDNRQEDPRIAMAADGSFVVIWSDAAGTDGDYWGVFGQRFDAAGQPVGSEFQVNTQGTGMQKYPSVAMASDGRFVVVWQSDEDQDGDRLGVFGQRFDAAGQPVGSEFQVNTFFAKDQMRPSVAMAPDGRFIVVWEGVRWDGTWGRTVLGQRFDADGTMDGTEFLIDDGPEVSGSKVAMAADGHFMVVWRDRRFDGDGWGIVGRLFGSDGTADASAFLVNTITTGGQISPYIAMAPDGRAVVIWLSDPQSQYVWHVLGQRFDATGAPAGGEFQVNANPLGQVLPVVAMAGDGSFLVAWNEDGRDGDDQGVFALRFDASGNGVGSEFQANKYVANKQWFPGVAGGQDGRFVLGWTSYGPAGNVFEVYAALYAADGTQVAPGSW